MQAPVQFQPYATLPEMTAWAAGIMASRDPDYTIVRQDGSVYLRRWWVIPRNEMCNVYLHEILLSDDDRAFHDHPWPNTSMILDGGYIEHTPDGITERSAGDVVSRGATALHRLVVPEGGRAVTLFMTGPKEREWGFACPDGWVRWDVFEKEGCGE